MDTYNGGYIWTLELHIYRFKYFVDFYIAFKNRIFYYYSITIYINICIIC